MEKGSWPSAFLRSVVFKSWLGVVSMKAFGGAKKERRNRKMDSDIGGPKSFIHTCLTHIFQSRCLFLSARRVKCLPPDQCFSSRGDFAP